MVVLVTKATRRQAPSSGGGVVAFHAVGVASPPPRPMQPWEEVTCVAVAAGGAHCGGVHRDGPGHHHRKSQRRQRMRPLWQPQQPQRLTTTSTTNNCHHR